MHLLSGYSLPTALRLIVFEHAIFVNKGGRDV